MLSDASSGQIREVLVLHHTHTDIGYTHPQPVLWELQRRFIDQALDCCEKTADWPEPSRFRWTCEVTSTLQYWLDRASSSQIDRFRALVNAGQISAGAMFSNGTPLSNVEQLARSLYPIQELRRTLGLPLSVAINHDVNGLPWPMTQLLLDAGVRMLLMGINVTFGGHPLQRPCAFRWRGADGRELLTWNGAHYAIFGAVLVGRPGLNTVESTDLMAEGLGRHLAQLAATGYPYDFVFMTGTHVSQCDNNPPYLKQAEMVRRWNAQGRSPRIRLVTPEELLERLEQLPTSAISGHTGDWTDYWNFGSGSAALETKVNRHSVRRLQAVEILRTRAAQDPDAALWSREAWWNANLYDEHTWGTAYPLGPCAEQAAEQWGHKAHYAYQARSLAGMLLRDQLELLAGNPDDAEGSQGLLLVNPAPVARQVMARIPQTLADGSWQHFSSSVQRLDTHCENLTESTVTWVGPVDLPAYGYCVLPLSNLPICLAIEEDKRLLMGEDFIESPFHRVSFDRKTGHITGLLDKRDQWEVIDASALWPFFGFVRETLDQQRMGTADQDHGGRDAFFKRGSDPLAPGASGWNPNWPALRNGPAGLRRIVTQRGAGQVTLVLEWEAAGVENLQQRITLFAHRPAIELAVSFRKTDVIAPEGIYFAFPVNLSAWQAYFDTADLPLEFDREQLPGVCRDWVTVGRWVAMADQRHGITLACPDTPLVQIGGFNFGRFSRSRNADAPPLLLSWVMNNYWYTNFRISQPGPVSFRYELNTHGPYSPTQSVQMGLEAAHAVEVHPVVTCTERIEGRFLRIEGEGVHAVGMKRAEDGQGIIVRLANVCAHPVKAIVRLPGWGIREAWRCDTLEKNQQSLEIVDAAVGLTLDGRALVSVRFVDDTDCGAEERRSLCDRTIPG